ncbi:Uncharacterised protein [Mycobacteroides abscessus subsp. abscessus]|nr:Uncharacterised protein [Mycobacteroides abscessus subsp. abscessus]
MNASGVKTKAANGVYVNSRSSISPLRPIEYRSRPSSTRVPPNRYTNTSICSAYVGQWMKTIACNNKAIARTSGPPHVIHRATRRVEPPSAMVVASIEFGTALASLSSPAGGSRVAVPARIADQRPTTRWHLRRRQDARTPN